MSEMLPASVIEESLCKIPLGRWAAPEEVADVVAWVASDQAAFLTGQTLVVDGGRAALEQEHGFLKRRLHGKRGRDGGTLGRYHRSG